MPAKAKAKAKGQAKAPKLLRSVTHKLAEISTAEDSGWRDVDAARVQELETIIYEGGWGATSLKGPSLISDNGGKVMHSTTDGNVILFDGKHVVAALRNVYDQYASKSEEERAGLEWLSEPLEEVLTKGLKMEVYQFAEYDRLTHKCWQALAHEQESNKLYHTTLHQKAQVMKDYFAQEGNDWVKARDAVLGVLGVQKLSTVNRWITLAKDLSQGLMEHIKSYKDCLLYTSPSPRD